MKLTLITLIAIVAFGCASSYKPIQPSNLVYSTTKNDDVKFGYRYEILSFRSNKKYAKRERKKNVRLVAIQIDNQSGKILKLGENYNIYSGENHIYPMTPESVFKELKQIVPIYLLYSLIVLNKTECNEMTGECKTSLLFPIGIPIAIGNMVVAGTANKNFLNELQMYSLINKEIQPGEKVVGLIGIPDTGFQPLKIVIE